MNNDDSKFSENVIKRLSESKDYEESSILFEDDYYHPDTNDIKTNYLRRLMKIYPTSKLNIYNAYYIIYSNTLFSCSSLSYFLLLYENILSEVYFRPYSSKRLKFNDD